MERISVPQVSPVAFCAALNPKGTATQVVVFGQKMSTQSVIGSSIAIGGVIVYFQVHLRPNPPHTSHVSTLDTNYSNPKILIHQSCIQKS